MPPTWLIIVGAVVVAVGVGVLWSVRSYIRQMREEYSLFVVGAQETLEPLLRKHGFEAKYENLGRALGAGYYKDHVGFAVGFDYVEGILGFNVVFLPLGEKPPWERLAEAAAASNWSGAADFLARSGQANDMVNTRKPEDWRPAFERWRRVLEVHGGLLLTGSRAEIAERMRQVHGR